MAANSTDTFFIKRKTGSERESIYEKVDAIKRDTFNALESTQVNSKLTGLYQAINTETAKQGKGTIIFDFAKLMEEENQLYSAEDAYNLAKDSTDWDEQELLKQYLYSIDQQMDDSGLTVRQQNMFNEICTLLGDVCSLITDFTETYRKVNGAVAQNIEIFIKRGCAARVNLFIAYDNRKHRKGQAAMGTNNYKQAK